MGRTWLCHAPMETKEKCHLAVIHPNRAFHSFRGFYHQCYFFLWILSHFLRSSRLTWCAESSARYRQTKRTGHGSLNSVISSENVWCGNLVKGKTSGLNPHQILQLCLKVHCWLRHEYRNKDTHSSWPKNKASVGAVQIPHLIFEQNLSRVLGKTEYQLNLRAYADKPRNSPVTSSDLTSSDILPDFWEWAVISFSFWLSEGSFLLTEEEWINCFKVIFPLIQ